MGRDITILVGTMTGTAEMVAQEVQQALEVAGHQATIRVMDGLDASAFLSGGAFLICTSTYGQGDVPDNAQALFSSLESEKPDLTGVIYGVIALGDRTYKGTYCHGGIRFDTLLTELGAKRAGEILTHDASSGTLPEEVAAQWVVPWAEQHFASDLNSLRHAANRTRRQAGRRNPDARRKFGHAARRGSGAMGGALGRAAFRILIGDCIDMATTAENPLATDAKMLQSYLAGKWQGGAERCAPLVNPCDGTVLAWASSQGLDLKAALDYSRNVGGPELRKLTYAQRAELLGKIADLLATRRDQWYEIARKNSGNTKADAAIDVDGSIGTLKYFAKIGAKLGDAHMLRAGSAMRLARDQNFQG